jgi:HSP20 family protein
LVQRLKRFQEKQNIMTNLVWKPGSFLSPVWNDLFQDEFFKSAGNAAKCTLPAVNIREQEEGWHLDLAVPGIPKDKIKIQLENHVLNISSEQMEQNVNEKYQRREFGYVAFNRSFTLPENIQIEGIHAKQEDGILSIFIPKEKPVKVEKRISIQ